MRLHSKKSHLREGTPAWRSGGPGLIGGNHNWVEVYDRGVWSFTGTGKYYDTLNSSRYISSHQTLSTGYVDSGSLNRQHALSKLSRCGPCICRSIGVY